jgi:signal transduction histidine kinase
MTPESTSSGRECQPDGGDRVVPTPDRLRRGCQDRLRGGWKNVETAVRHATDVDGVLAMAAFVALVINPVLTGREGELTPLAGLLAALTAVPLVVRRRYPVAVLAIVTTGLLICLAVFHPTQAAAGIIIVAVFTVGLTGRRVRTLIVGASMAPVVAAGVAITSHKASASGDVLAYPAVVLLALAAGDAVRSRRALRLAVAEEALRESEADAQHRFDQQRLQVANELHDTIAHALVAINIRAAAAAHQRNGVGDEAWAVLDEIKRTSTEALADLRTTLRILRSAPEEAPMQPTQTLSDLTELVERAQGAGISIGLNLAPIADPIPSATSHAAYRIVQEALTNVLRHSTAHHADVTVGWENGTLTVDVTDNGRADHRRAGGDGHGLRGMAERAAALGGSCVAGPGRNGGWEVHTSLPARALDP